MRSSTEAWRHAAQDLAHLLRFRVGTVRRPGRLGLAVVLLLGLTLFFAVAPQLLHATGEGEAAELLRRSRIGTEDSLGPALAVFLLLAIAATAGTGGGRELLSRDQAAIHPISPVTDHLGALVLAPLNFAWMVQAWGLVAATSLVTASSDLVAGLLVLATALVAATALAQAVGWGIEGVRRTSHGVLVVRATTVVLIVVAAVVHLTGRLGAVLDALPTTWVAASITTGSVLALPLLALVTCVAVWAGGRSAAWALSLPPKDELRTDSGVHEARPAPAPRWVDADLALLVRMDRASVWRSAGMRRGFLFLGLGPGLIVLLADANWVQVSLLPGLVVSGTALMFGVNAWCLDGRGAVWRDSLPVPPARVFDARAIVLGECLLAGSAIPILCAVLRKGIPPLDVGVTVVTLWAVCGVQVWAVCMTWSGRRPHGVDLSSPRATPVPHVAMAGYAARLSLVTTLTGVLFVTLGSFYVPGSPAVFPTIVVGTGVVFVVWSALRLRRARRRWLAPPQRALTVLTVAAV